MSEITMARSVWKSANSTGGSTRRRPPDEGANVQLATRIPAELHRRVKLFCVQEELMVRDFAREAFEEYLRAHPLKETKGGDAQGAD